VRAPLSEPDSRRLADVVEPRAKLDRLPIRAIAGIVLAVHDELVAELAQAAGECRRISHSAANLNAFNE
jgi:hypothetical protein